MTKTLIPHCPSYVLCALLVAVIILFLLYRLVDYTVGTTPRQLDFQPDRPKGLCALSVADKGRQTEGRGCPPSHLSGPVSGPVGPLDFVRKIP